VSEKKKPNIMDHLQNREIRLVINIPSHEGDPASHRILKDEYLIRRKAAEFGIPIVTNLELARALTKALVRHNARIQSKTHSRTPAFVTSPISTTTVRAPLQAHPLEPSPSPSPSLRQTKIHRRLTFYSRSVEVVRSESALTPGRPPAYGQTKRHGRVIAIVAVMLFLAAMLLPLFNIEANNLVVYNCIGCVRVRGSLTYLLFQCGEVQESGVVPDPHYTGNTYGGAIMWFEKYTFSCLGSGW
jgi:hypothetical protein